MATPHSVRYKARADGGRMAQETKADVSFIRRRPVLTLLALTVLVSIPLVLFPEIDIAVSRLFYVEGRGFIGESTPFLIVIREVGKDAVRLISLVILISLLVPLLIARVRFLLPPRAALFLFTSLVAGPGIIVNAILKEHWGRARPRSITEFGGSLDFSRPWEIVSQCDSNCSFVSGEGSVAIWFLALAMIVPLKWRLPTALVLFVLATIMSVNRIAFGGHFFSDVLIGWMLMLSVVVLCYQIFYKSGLTDEKVDAGFARVRDFLHAPFRLLFGR